MADRANAQPTKRLFVYMLTRDISLEYAILDLVDNAIDALIKERGADDIKEIVTGSLLGELKNRNRKNLKSIDITVNNGVFSIKDNCGGAGYTLAKNVMFRFGKEQVATSSLSVYGIGLKRACFKIGRDITVRSSNEESGFTVKFHVDEWLKDKKWSFPLEKYSPSKELIGYTEVIIKEFNKDIEHVLAQEGYIAKVKSLIARTYNFFIGSLVKITVNGETITPVEIPFGSSASVTPFLETAQYENVKITILASLVDKEFRKQEHAGWYVLCNGRTVVSSDQTDLTGWGDGLPRFQPKYRGFIGIVFLMSEETETLPWTTTKRGLNTDSYVYRFMRGKMDLAARPVLSFLDKMYPSSEPEEHPVERAIADSVKKVDIREVMRANKPTLFAISQQDTRIKDTVNVQLEVLTDDIERARRALKQPRLSARKVVEHAFRYFLKKECSE